MATHPAPPPRPRHYAEEPGKAASGLITAVTFLRGPTSSTLRGSDPPELPVEPSGAPRLATHTYTHTYTHTRGDKAVLFWCGAAPPILSYFPSVVSGGKENKSARPFAMCESSDLCLHWPDAFKREEGAADCHWEEEGGLLRVCVCVCVRVGAHVCAYVYIQCSTCLYTVPAGSQPAGSSTP